MSEDRYINRLGDYVDGTLSDSDRRVFEVHLAACESCRTTLEELSSIRRAAGALPRHEPPPDVWKTIEASLGAPPPVENVSRPWLFSSHLAVAATLLVLIAAMGLLFWWSPFTKEPDTEDTGQLANYIVSELESAERHYVNAIAGLEQILEKEKQGQILDPEVMAVLNDNLDLIERAIGESRAAAREDPEDILVRESLLDALRNKLALLQNTITLINQVRKGRGESAYDRPREMPDDPGISKPI